MEIYMQIVGTTFNFFQWACIHPLSGYLWQWNDLERWQRQISSHVERMSLEINFTTWYVLVAMAAVDVCVEIRNCEEKETANVNCHLINSLLLVSINKMLPSKCLSPPSTAQVDIRCRRRRESENTLHLVAMKWNLFTLLAVMLI